jgi:hypothetical protein
MPAAAETATSLAAAVEVKVAAGHLLKMMHEQMSLNCRRGTRG